MPGKHPGKNQPTGSRKEGLPAASAVVKAARKPSLITSAMLMEDKLRCLELYAELKDIAMVATKMGRAEEGVRKFLARYQATTTGARMVMEAGAERLAARVIKNANVEESLEVLDRLDVLSAKRDKTGPSSSFSLIIGMPSTQAKPGNIDIVPVPDQKRIDASIIDAEIVKVEVPVGESPS